MRVEGKRRRKEEVKTKRGGEQKEKNARDEREIDSEGV